MAIVLYPKMSRPGVFGGADLERLYRDPDYVLLIDVRPRNIGGGEVIRDQDVREKILYSRSDKSGLVPEFSFSPFADPVPPLFWRAPDETAWAAAIAKKSAAGFDLFPLALDGSVRLPSPGFVTSNSVVAPSYATYRVYMSNKTYNPETTEVEFSDGSVEVINWPTLPDGLPRERVIGPYASGKFPVTLSPPVSDTTGVSRLMSWSYPTLPADAANNRLQSGWFVDGFLPGGVV